MRPVLGNVHWRIFMIPVFANVTLEDLYDTCGWQCYIRGFLWHLCLPMLH